MRRYIDWIDNAANGSAVSGAQVRVVSYPDGDAATIYSDDGDTAIANSTVTSDADGMFSFYAPAGRYSLQISVGGTLVETVENVHVGGDVSVRDYGAVGDGITDDRAAFQAAMNAVGALGGGRVTVPATGSFYAISSGTTDSITVSLTPLYDNIEIHLEGGAVVRQTINSTLFGIAGFFKAAGGVTGWAAYEAADSTNHGVTFTLYAIASASKFADSVVLSTPAQHSNFQVSDWILIRTGQTVLTGGYSEPIGEYNKIRAIDAGTGELSLEYPLKNDYAPENYPVGHPDAGTPAPFGIINVTRPVNAILQNFSITGHGRLENTSAATTRPLLNGSQTVGRVIDGPEFISYTDAFSESHSLDRMVNVRVHLLGTGNLWGYSKATTAHDWLLDDAIITAKDQAQIHLHEGCSGKIGSGVTIISGNPAAASTTENIISIRARAHDISIGDIKIFGFGKDASTPAIYGDDTTDRITIGSATITGAVNSSALAVNLLGGDNNVGPVFTDTGILVSPDLGSQLAGGLTRYIPASDLTTFQGSPTLALTATNRHYAWLLDAATDEAVVWEGRAPPGWKKFRVRLWYTNHTADAGDIRWQVFRRARSDGDDLATATDANTSFTETAPAQYILKKSTTPAFDWTVTDPQFVQILVFRDADNAADTKAGDIALMGIELVRVF